MGINKDQRHGKEVEETEDVQEVGPLPIPSGTCGGFGS